MRTTFLIALLAGTVLASPAIAQDRGDDRRAARAEARDKAPDRPARAQRTSDDSDRPAPAPRQARNDSAPRPEPRQRDFGAVGPSPEVEPQAPRQRPAVADHAPVARRDAGDTVRNWRRNDRQRPDSASAVEARNLGTAPVADGRSIEERNLRRADRAERRGALDRQVRTTPGISDRRLGRIGRNVPVEGSAPPPPDRASLERGRTTRHWRGDWRSDRRYDWRRHRDRNRSKFRLGFYFDPFGWSYRRYNVGWRLWPSYYGNSYWLHDPWMYRLPPAYGPYRWIRYHDDALLVNIYTGEVVDVIYSFFW